MFSKYAQIAEHLQQLDGNKVTLSFSDIERLLGASLPKSARRSRKWWCNDVSHVQAKYGWLTSGWHVKDVDFEGETVSFIRRRDASACLMLRPIDEFKTSALQRLSQFYGVRFVRGVKAKLQTAHGVVEKNFDFGSEDGQIVCKVMYLTEKGNPAARFQGITVNAMLLEKALAKERLLVFGGDKIVPLLWLESAYACLVDNVKLVYIGEKVEVLN
ncbi:MAG: hypothetical protein NWF09_07490 [Candidatus Bathyarchaeota archaeon]|nr:hypothetical protein [Candidatus Bathyarchaeota archaeon]